MKTLFEDLMYMCSASNTTSRGFYMFIVAALVMLTLGSLVSLVLLIINAIQGFFSVMFLVLFIITVLCVVGLLVWLKKS